MWYSARLIVQCVVGTDQESDHLFDEQVRIIAAGSPEEAYEKAVRLGRSEEQEYRNVDGEVVRWTFRGLFDLDTIDELKDGAEVSSKRFRADSEEDFVFPKEKLSVFYQRTLKGKTVQQLLDEQENAG